jgi:hypothetical protein
MKKIIVLAAITVLGISLTAAPPHQHVEAQTLNQHAKIIATEEFTFPNDCTNELMDVSDTTVVTCHDQLRTDGTINEKCEIRQDVTAIGETTGIIWHGEATFKDETITSDACNFSFSNLGRVNLLSAGNAPNTIITFDDVVHMENCVLTEDQHLVSFDCRGEGNL